MSYIPVLFVAIAREADLLHRIGVLGPLDKLDRGNIEKMLGLYRHMVVTSEAG